MWREDPAPQCPSARSLIDAMCPTPSATPSPSPPPIWRTASPAQRRSVFAARSGSYAVSLGADAIAIARRREGGASLRFGGRAGIVSACPVLMTAIGWRDAVRDNLVAMSANSSDEIAVFQAYIDLINSERETIWARHNALLVANSLIVGALAISPTALWANKWAALAMLGAGLLISGAWLVITIQGWSVMRRHAELAGPSPRPLSSTCQTRSPRPSVTGPRRRSIGSLAGDGGFHPHVSGIGLYPLGLGLSGVL